MGEKQSSDVRSLNIYQKLSAIMGEIGVVEKGGKNTEQNYAFIEYAAVAGKLRALFSEYGVLIVPRMPKASEHVREEITTKYGSKGVAILIDFTFEIINADKPDDKFEVTWTGEAADYGDKGTNKAATSALKYYLMRQFNISEKGEDNDEHSIDRGSTETAPAKPITKKVTYISKATLQAIQKGLADKGIEADDIDDTIKRLAKVEDLDKINVASGKAILEKVTKANSQALREFVYGGDPNGEDNTVPEDPNNESTQDHPDITSPDEPSQDEIEAAAEEPAADPEPVVDDEFKATAWEMYESLPIKSQYKLRWLKDVTGAISKNSIKTDEKWRALMDRAGAVLSGDEEIPADQRTDAGEQGKIV